MDVIKEIRAQGTTVLLVEQNARAALRVADRADVIESGVTTVEGQASDLRNDPPYHRRLPRRVAMAGAADAT